MIGVSVGGSSRSNISQHSFFLLQLLKKLSRVLYNVVVLFIPWEVRIKKIESELPFLSTEFINVILSLDNGQMLSFNYIDGLNPFSSGRFPINMVIVYALHHVRVNLFRPQKDTLLDTLQHNCWCVCVSQSQSDLCLVEVTLGQAWRPTSSSSAGCLGSTSS